LESFDTVLLDFKGIKSIGQAFADEIFRVFKLSHPNIGVDVINAAEGVRYMIDRAKNKELENL